MATTPSKLKTVSFKLPKNALIPPGITSNPPLPPPPNTTTITTHQHRPYTAPPSLSVVRRGQRSGDPKTTPTPGLLGPKPDLVADIPEEETQKDDIVVEKMERPVSRPSRSDSPLTPSPAQIKATRGVNHSRSFANATSTRDRSLYFDHRLTSGKNKGLSSSQVAQVANKVREKTNSTSHDHIRSLKHDVSKMREQLLKVEEEIKNLNRGRSTMEMTVQDIRKALSVNQQSISTQLKKSSRGEEDSSIRLLREEARVLSKGKQSVEQHLQTVKAHLQGLDGTRRMLQTKISSLSRALELDAQNFKVYDGPIHVRSGSVSRQRHYASAYPPPKTRVCEDGVAELCTKALDSVAASRSVRGEIKSLIVSVQTKKMEAHQKITTALARKVEEAKTQQREILLERGQVRMAQNTANHQKHSEEIALGIVLGPVSDKHRSVSEKMERPLSRLRPASALEEKANLKETKTKLTRQLSATTVRVSNMSESDSKLLKRLRAGSHATVHDTHTLRIRKMSLDNRWVQ